jgi:isoleucyl-tRNA synthetase
MTNFCAREESVHLAYFPRSEEIIGESGLPPQAETVRTDFDTLMSLRAEVMKALEVARKEKLIGSGLEAAVTIHAPGNVYDVLERYRDSLRFLLIVSKTEVRRVSEGNGHSPLAIEVSKAPGQKCARCWNYSEQVGKDAQYPTVCERCLATLKELERTAVV